MHEAISVNNLSLSFFFFLKKHFGVKLPLHWIQGDKHVSGADKKKMNTQWHKERMLIAANKQAALPSHLRNSLYILAWCSFQIQLTWWQFKQQLDGNKSLSLPRAILPLENVSSLYPNSKSAVKCNDKCQEKQWKSISVWGRHGSTWVFFICGYL